VVVPVVGNVPLQPPDAAHVLALVALHCSVTGVPTATVFSLAFRLTTGGATAAGVAPVLVAAALVGPLLAVVVSAFELMPHAASEPNAANTNIDFNANANLEQRLRRIELITRLPRFSVTIFCAELDSVRPQSLRSHIQSIFQNRQPVAICKLHMFSDAISSFAFSKIENLHERILVAHWRHRCGSLWRPGQYFLVAEK